MLNKDGLWQVNESIVVAKLIKFYLKEQLKIYIEQNYLCKLPRKRFSLYALYLAKPATRLSTPFSTTRRSTLQRRRRTPPLSSPARPTLSTFVSALPIYPLPGSRAARSSALLASCVQRPLDTELSLFL